ncbi:MAG TPA: hypothetical protein EYP60_07945 [bacterium (Candidatus Stahlbacteria)]|nr:hypothetical protein [Candidatus Stahlbacteria bacterium]
MSVRFIQTGDIHLDTKFSGIRDDEKRAKRQEEQRECLKKIISIVKNRRPDFLLMAGDLFEQKHFSPDTINFIIGQLKSIPDTPVYVVAGNHDPYEQTSPYNTYEWPTNVHIFGPNFESLALTKKNVVIHGISVTHKLQNTPVLRNYSVPKDGSLHIVLMHGSEESDCSSMDTWERWLPFTQSDIEACGADWYAVGHYHKCRPIPFQGTKIMGYYAGCPEPTKFNETGEKYIIEVELTKNDEPKVKKIEDQQIRTYREITIPCDGFKSREQVKEKIDSLSTLYKNDIVKIILKGYTHPDFELRLDILEDELKANFFGFDIENNTHTDYNLDKIRQTNSLIDHFLKEIEKVKTVHNKEVVEQAKILGLDALLRQRVRSYED